MYHSMRNFLLISNFQSKKFFAHVFRDICKTRNWRGRISKFLLKYKFSLNFLSKNIYIMYMNHIYESLFQINEKLNNGSLLNPAVEFWKSASILPFTFLWRFEWYITPYGLSSLVAKISVESFSANFFPTRATPTHYVGGGWFLMCMHNFVYIFI